MKNLKFKHTILLSSTLSLASCFMALSKANALSLKVTEIMYDQYSEYQTDYNWIEFQYLGDTQIDLSNYLFSISKAGRREFETRCFNPFDSNCVSQEGLEKMQQSNIPLTSTIILPGDVFVMYGSVVRDARNDWGNSGLRPFTQMWDPDGTRDINFITTYWPDCPVGHRPWCGIGITPGNGIS